MEKVRELDQAGAFISYIYHIVQVSFPFTLSLIPGIKMKKYTVNQNCRVKMNCQEKSFARVPQDVNKYRKCFERNGLLKCLKCFPGCQQMFKEL